MRWSNGDERFISLRATTGRREAGPLDDAVDADDGHFRVVDDRGGGDAADRAEAGNGDGRTTQFLARGLAGAYRVGKACDFGGGLPQVQRFCMGHDRHRQADLALRGDAQLHAAVAGDDVGFIVVARIHLREVAQGQHDGAGQERQQGELAASAVARLSVARSA